MKSDVQQDILICPICNRHLTMDNTQFNKHVDECLNKVEVKTILENEKRQLSSSSSSSGSSSHSRHKKLKRQVKSYNQMLLLIEY